MQMLLFSSYQYVCHFSFCLFLYSMKIYIVILCLWFTGFAINSQSNPSEVDDCPICYIEIIETNPTEKAIVYTTSKGNSVIVAECNHRYCKYCYDEYTIRYQGRKCPICRGSLFPDDPVQQGSIERAIHSLSYFSGSYYKWIGMVLSMSINVITECTYIWYFIEPTSLVTFIEPLPYSTTFPHVLTYYLLDLCKFIIKKLHILLMLILVFTLLSAKFPVIKERNVILFIMMNYMNLLISGYTTGLCYGLNEIIRSSSIYYARLIYFIIALYSLMLFMIMYAMIVKPMLHIIVGINMLTITGCLLVWLYLTVSGEEFSAFMQKNQILAMLCICSVINLAGNAFYYISNSIPCFDVVYIHNCA